MKEPMKNIRLKKSLWERVKIAALAKDPAVSVSALCSSFIASGLAKMEKKGGAK